MFFLFCISYVDVFFYFVFLKLMFFFIFVFYVDFFFVFFMRICFHLAGFVYDILSNCDPCNPLRVVRLL